MTFADDVQEQVVDGGKSLSDKSISEKRNASVSPARNPKYSLQGASASVPSSTSPSFSPSSLDDRRLSQDTGNSSVVLEEKALVIEELSSTQNSSSQEQNDSAPDGSLDPEASVHESVLNTEPALPPLLTHELINPSEEDLKL